MTIEEENGNKIGGLSGLRTEIKELRETIESGGRPLKKKKGFVLPAKVRAKAKKAALKNSVVAFLLRNNRNIDVVMGKMEDGMVQIGEKFHAGSMDYTFLYRGKIPAMIIPEWSLEPIGTKDYYDAVENNKTIDAQSIILRAIEAKELAGKKKIGGKALIWIIIAAAVIGYALFGQG